MFNLSMIKRVKDLEHDVRLMKANTAHRLKCLESRVSDLEDTYPLHCGTSRIYSLVDAANALFKSGTNNVSPREKEQLILDVYKYLYTSHIMEGYNDKRTN